MDSETSLIRARVAWLDSFRKATAFLMDGAFETIEVHRAVDPLKVLIKIPLARDIHKRSREPLRSYLRAWADTFNCHVPRININDKYIQAEVLLKQRIWKEGSFVPKQRHRWP